MTYDLGNKIIAAIEKLETGNMSDEISREYNQRRDDEEYRARMQKAFKLESMIGFLEVFAQEHIGANYSLNYAAILEYIESTKFALSEGFNKYDLEGYYRYIEQQALAGLPLWRFLNINERARKMLEDLFQIQLEKEDVLSHKTRPCLSCKNWKQTPAMFGTLSKCEKHPNKLSERAQHYHNPLKRRVCRNYIPDEAVVIKYNINVNKFKSKQKPTWEIPEKEPEDTGNCISIEISKLGDPEYRAGLERQIDEKHNKRKP